MGKNKVKITELQSGLFSPADDHRQSVMAAVKGYMTGKKQKQAYRRVIKQGRATNNRPGVCAGKAMRLFE